MNKIEWPSRLTIGWLKEKYRSQEITPEDTVREILRRVKQDEAMNIWITPPRMEQLEPYLARLREVEMDKLPLFGIPFAIKDNIDLAGVPTTAACPEFAYVPDKSAVVVQRLIDAGAIPLGKTNLDQFATGLVGTRSPYGETHNALNPELISGGSSSGSSVAVAKGQCAFALGTDTAGSGRVPAALNRIYGFKSSLGAWPTKGVVPACASLDCVTVFTNELKDVFEVDRTVRGLAEGDPWSYSFSPMTVEEPKRICLPSDPLDFFGPFAQKYEQAWNHAVKRLTEMGIPITWVSIDLFKEAAAILYDGPWVAERWADLGDFVERNPDYIHPVTSSVLRSGASPQFDAASVFRAMHRLQEIKLSVREMLKDAVLVLPTCGGTWTREQLRKQPIEANSSMGRYTNHCNLLDLCALAVPSDDADTNLPFGITFFALSHNEALIHGAGAQFTGVPSQKLIENTENNEDSTLLAVCGLHMRGYALEKQMVLAGAKFVREALTAPKYQLVKLASDPPKPGLIKRRTGGQAVQVELWNIPLKSFGKLAASIPAPLGIGKIELESGQEVPGFVCEAYSAEDAEDITFYGGWRNFQPL